MSYTIVYVVIIILVILIIYYFYEYKEKMTINLKDINLKDINLNDLTVKEWNERHERNGKKGLDFLHYTSEGCLKFQLYHFDHPKAAQAYNDLVQEFGEANVVADTPGGIVIWNHPDFYEEIILRDEAYEHLEITYMDHCDFLYSTIRVQIPDDLVCLILNLSKSLTYNRINKNLTSFCFSSGANLAILWLAMMLTINPDHFEAIRAQFSKAIHDSKNLFKYKKMHDELKEMVRNNQAKYASIMPNRQCPFTSS